MTHFYIKRTHSTEEAVTNCEFSNRKNCPLLHNNVILRYTEKKVEPKWLHSGTFWENGPTLSFLVGNGTTSSTVEP